MSFFWWLLAVLVAWGAITLWRRLADDGDQSSGASSKSDAQTPSGSKSPGIGSDDEIDREELDRAEREVKDLDVNARPEDGFEGDDWGPGTSRKPPLA